MGMRAFTSQAAGQRLCALEDVPDEEGLVVTLEGHAFAVWNVDGKVYVTDDTCSHGQASLVRDGMLDGFEIVCGLHHGSFDVRTGAVMSAPCIAPIRSYASDVIDGQVYVSWPAPGGAADGKPA